MGYEGGARISVKSNKRENSNRIPHEYKKGDCVLLTTPGKIPKLRSPRTGPCKVVNVHDNGTMTIKPGHVQQRINIRWILPYHQN